jgi:hypothetical protein
MIPSIIAFSENNGLKKCFLGTYQGATEFGKEGMNWHGDQVESESANNNVNYYYMDEYVPPSGDVVVGAGTSNNKSDVAGTSKSIFGRWF